MSKFFITNDKDLFLKIKTRVEDSPFETCLERQGDIYCVTTKKLTIDNVNGKDFGNGFISITGTLIWGDGEIVNGTILDKIWKKYNGDISSIRNSCVGNYAVTISNDNSGLIFSDLSGFYNVYYYYSDSAWVVSNSLYDLFIILKGKLTINRMGVVEFIRQNGILNGGTQFSEIRRLRGYDYLKFSNNSIECIVDDYQYPMSSESIDHQVKKYVEFSKKYAEKTYKAYGRPTISMTGGLDARMLLASYLSIGVKPDLYYGTGNSLITNTHKEDKEIDRLYRKKFNLKLYEESWATPSPMDKFWNKYLELFGFHYDIYASSEDVMTSVINNPNNYFVLGEGGEMLRNQTWIDERTTDYFTLEEYINDFYVPDDMKDSIVDPAKFVSHITDKYLDICNYYHLDPSHIANEDIFILTLERRKTADSATVNWMNFIRYDSVQMIQYEGLLAARVKCKDTADAKFMLYCENMLCPEILEVPIFSHCKLRKFNRNSMSISEEISLYRHIKDVARKSTPLLFSILKKFFSKDQIKKSSTNVDIYERALSLYKEFNTDNLFNIDKFQDQRSLIKYIMFLYAINK